MPAMLPAPPHRSSLSDEHLMIAAQAPSFAPAAALTGAVQTTCNRNSVGEKNSNVSLQAEVLEDLKRLGAVAEDLSVAIQRDTQEVFTTALPSSSESSKREAARRCKLADNIGLATASLRHRPSFNPMLERSASLSPRHPLPGTHSLVPIASPRSPSQSPRALSTKLLQQTPRRSKIGESNIVSETNIAERSDRLII